MSLAEFAQKPRKSPLDGSQIAAGAIEPHHLRNGVVQSWKLAADLQSDNYAAGSAGWFINRETGDVEFNNGTFRGTLTAGAIDIPDTATASSFHVDSTGRMWIGATAFASAPFRVSAAGDVTASSVSLTNAAITTPTITTPGISGGSITGTSIDVPDTTTASSFHVDSTGKMWIGKNASNYATAPFRVSAAGDLVASSATITGAINATSGSFSGTITASGTISGGTISGATVTGTTITGGTIQTATSGGRLKIDTTDAVEPYYTIAATSGLSYASGYLRFSEGNGSNGYAEIKNPGQTAYQSSIKINANGYVDINTQGYGLRMASGDDIVVQSGVVDITNSSTEPLYLKGSSAGMKMDPRTGTYAWTTYVDNGYCNWYANGAQRMKLNDAGTDLRFPSILTTGITGTALVIDTSSGQVGQTSSSIKYKTNVATMVDGLDLVRRLRPVRFDWNEHVAGTDGHPHAAGVIIEEAVRVLPEGVIHDRDGEPVAPYDMAYTAALISAVQQLDDRLTRIGA